MRLACPHCDKLPVRKWRIELCEAGGYIVCSTGTCGLSDRYGYHDPTRLLNANNVSLLIMLETWICNWPFQLVGALTPTVPWIELDVACFIESLCRTQLAALH